MSDQTRVSHNGIHRFQFPKCRSTIISVIKWLCIIRSNRDVTKERTRLGSDVSSRAKGSLCGRWERKFPRSSSDWSGNNTDTAAAGGPSGPEREESALGRAWMRVAALERLQWIRVAVWSFLRRCEMGKEQELLEAARTGNLAAVEKLLSGKRQSAGSAAASGAGSSGNIGSGGHSSSHTLSSLLR